MTTPKKGRGGRAGRKTQKPAVEPAAEAVSVRELARRLQISHTAVLRGIERGRLGASVTHLPDGTPKIANVELAVKEWEASRRPRVDSGARDAASRYQAARAAREEALAELARDELLRKRGELVRARDMEAHMADVFLRCRTRIMGAVPRLRERDPTLTAPQLDLIDTLIREALEELASGHVEA